MTAVVIIPEKQPQRLGQLLSALPLGQPQLVPLALAASYQPEELLLPTQAQG